MRASVGIKRDYVSFDPDLVVAPACPIEPQGERVGSVVNIVLSVWLPGGKAEDSAESRRVCLVDET